MSARRATLSLVPPPVAAETDFRAIVEASAEAVIVTDARLEPPGPVIRYVNSAFCRLSGYPAEAVLGRDIRLLHGPATDAAVLRAQAATLRRGAVAEGCLVHYGLDGRPYRILQRTVPLAGADGAIRHFAAFQRAAPAPGDAADGLPCQASCDRLTGVASRSALLEVLARHMRAAPTGSLGFAALDIDSLGEVNDSLGHVVGDAVLLGFADLLGASLRRGDVIGRLGGEAFGLCLPGIRPPEARSLAGRLREAVEAQIFETPAGTIHITCSIGLTMARPDDLLSDVLLRAERALQAAKRQGRNRVVMG